MGILAPDGSPCAPSATMPDRWGVNATGVDAEFVPGTALRGILVMRIGHVAVGGRFPLAPLGFEQAVTIL